MNKEILILYSCDNWFSHDSKRIIGVFENRNLVATFIRKNFKQVGQAQIENLLQNNQTYNTEPNLLINTEKLNPKKL